MKRVYYTYNKTDSSSTFHFEWGDVRLSQNDSFVLTRSLQGIVEFEQRTSFLASLISDDDN